MAGAQRVKQSLTTPLEQAADQTGLSQGKLREKLHVSSAKRDVDLRTTLLWVFAAGAIAFTLFGVAGMARMAQSALERSTSQFGELSADAIRSTSSEISQKARQQVDNTGQQLTDIGGKAVRSTSAALLDATQLRFAEANRALIEQGEQAIVAVGKSLVHQSERAAQALANTLIRLNSESNAEMTRSSARLSEKALQRLADEVVAESARNTNQIAQVIVNQTTDSAKRLSERIVQDIEREPVVNFKILASIFAQGIASNKVTPIQDGYLAVVDTRGRVVASTRFKKGTSLRQLDIVARALEGRAPEDQLIRFMDGGAEYLGVFARREEGGAVVFAYKAARARVDNDRIQGDIARTLNQMNASASQLVVQNLAAQRPVLQRQAQYLAKQSIAQLKANSDAMSKQTAATMREQAANNTRQAVAAMNGQALTIADEAVRKMKTRSESIAAGAVSSLRPIGNVYASQAETAMRQKCEAAVIETRAVVERSALAAASRASLAMAPTATALSTAVRQRLWLFALALVGIEVILVVLASRIASGHIATPIMRQQAQARAEKARLSREMEIASRIQTSLLPVPPHLNTFDVALSMVPAEEVGGDFVEIIPAGESDKFWVGVGDVTGHGLTPGLIMMMAQSCFGALAAQPRMTPKALYDGLNQVLFHNIRDRLKTSDHMTMSVLQHTGDGQFVHCGAHLDILIYRQASNQVERIVTDGPWVALLPDSTPFTVEQTFALRSGDVLVFYTDGLIEVQNQEGEQWDMDRLCLALKQHGMQDSATIRSRLLEESLLWANRVLDDISLVVIKKK